MDLDQIPEPLIHESIRPTREGIVGELVFSQHWAALMADRPDWEIEEQALREILCDLRGAPTQRDATVAATFIQWLGTNIGSCLLHEARAASRDNDSAYHRSRAHLAAWSLHNHRQLALNGGLRAIELLLAPPKGYHFDGLPKVLPQLSIRDYEVIEHVAAWLGSNAGQAFLRGCQEEIDIRQDAAHRAMRAFNKTRWSGIAAGRSTPTGQESEDRD